MPHAYMYFDETRYDHTGPDQQWNPHGDYSTPGNPNDGQELWDELVKNHDFALAASGHVLGDGTGFLTTPNLAGQDVHQMLVNYQFLGPLGGNGYIRLLTIHPDGTVQARSYSPVYNNWNIAADQQFSFDFEWYAPADSNANLVADYFDAALDSDGDGIDNREEFVDLGTDPFGTDSDGDGIGDGLEVQIGTDPAVSEKTAAEGIIGNADLFGLYNEQDILDLNLGTLMITPNGNQFDLSLQLETADDLDNFHPHGDPINWSIIVPADRHFMRVKATP